MTNLLKDTTQNQSNLQYTDWYFFPTCYVYEISIGMKIQSIEIYS